MATEGNHTDLTLHCPSALVLNPLLEGKILAKVKFFSSST